MLTTLLLLLAAQETTLTAPTVEAAPTLDGKADDACWSKAKELKVAVVEAMDNTKGKSTVTVKAVRKGDELYLLLQWKDESESAQHKPWVWDKEKNEYIEATDVEDCAVVSFALSGEFDANMLAGIESTWDVWHWKAARTNPAGFAMDKRHIYSEKKSDAKAMKYRAINDKDIWISRPEDGGGSATKKTPKPEKLTDKVVQQSTAQTPAGSAADVKAKGAWKDGVWTLELCRKLKTGNEDDAVFEPGKAIPFAIAILDASEEEHSASGKLSLLIEK